MIIRQEAKDVNNTSVRIKSLLENVKAKKLLSLVIEPSSKCNLKCSFCAMHSGEYDLNERKGIMHNDLYDKLIRDIALLNYKIKIIQFHGCGEPLLNRDIYSMISKIKKLNIAEKLKIITNGVLLNEKNLQKLVLSGINTIDISLDVFGKNNYLDIKGHDFFDKVIKNIYQAVSTISKISARGGGGRVDRKNYGAAARFIWNY